MSCERYAEAIVDHACGADIDTDAAVHLRACGECTALFDEQRHLLQEMDRDLERALDVDPSVGFARAVRTRVEESAASRKAIWWGALAAAAAILIVVSVVSRQSDDRRIASRMEEPASPVVSTPATSLPPSPAPVQRPASAARRQTPRSQPRQATATRAPDPPARTAAVLVPADQSRALGRYMALIRQGAFDAANLEPRIGTTAPADLEVTPLAVRELAVPDVESGTGPDVVRRGPE